MYNILDDMQLPLYRYEIQDGQDFLFFLRRFEYNIGVTYINMGIFLSTQIRILFFFYYAWFEV